MERRENKPMSTIDFAQMMDVQCEIDEYFEPEELQKMTPWVKKGYRNLRANYEVMKKWVSTLTS